MVRYLIFIKFEFAANILRFLNYKLQKCWKLQTTKIFKCILPCSFLATFFKLQKCCFWPNFIKYVRNYKCVFLYWSTTTTNMTKNMCFWTSLIIPVTNYKTTFIDYKRLKSQCVLSSIYTAIFLY